MSERFALLVAIAAVFGACAYKVERNLIEPSRSAALDSDSEYLKAHMRDGELYVLTAWDVSAADQRVRGQGTRLDYNRRILTTGPFDVPLDSVALFETNAARVSSSIVPLTVMTIGTAAVGVYCAINPKACFGSCPTFYVPGEDGQILAEGFSASVAPSLEDTDRDALPSVRPAGGVVRLEMRNEALETHVVRWADLIAVPRGRAQRVYSLIDGTLRRGSAPLPPSRCVAEEGDCRAQVEKLDGTERTSLADSVDLAAREWMELEFPIDPSAEGRQLGLAIGSRQSLLPTYVLYQGLAFMGTRAGEWLAALERGNEGTRERTNAIGRVLGGIDVYTTDPDGEWVLAGSVQETGPLGTDVRVVPLPRIPSGEALRVRLRLTRGMWRIDQAELVVLGEEVSPIRVRPSLVLRAGAADTSALARLRSRTDALVTLPGDAYTLVYELPDGHAYELFLESRGYYLEWMRAEWLAEENNLRAARMFLDPAGSLRAMAPEYKRIEPEMERIFWSSRYGATR
jgi:hypothetical protein